MTKISLHHIGGRSGSRSFPVLKSFEKDIVSVLYEADKDCMEDIIEKNKKHGNELHVFPYCVGGANGKASFNLNYDPYTSSLLPFNSDYKDYYLCNSDGQDYILGEVCKLEKSIDVDIATLDSILKTSTIQKPDFLSIDTQGSEYEILQGADDLLEKNILGLTVEVEFKQFYKNQKLFGDINELLTSRGFEFIKFIGSFPEYSPYRAPIGLRGEGHHITTDALYLKREVGIGRKTYDDFVKLTKLAFFSIAFQQLETGLQYLSIAREMTIAKEIREDLERYSYYRFLLELEQRASQVKKVYPPKFTEKYTSFDECCLRYDQIAIKKQKETSIMTSRDKIVTMIKKCEPLYKLLWVVRKFFKDISRGGGAIINNLKLKMQTTNSPIEQLLCDYGFDELSRTVKLKRLKQNK